MSCERCGSHAINQHLHGRDGSDPSLCDVCYWRARAEDWRRRLDDAIREAHIYQGYCPDKLQPDAYDPECPACQSLLAIAKATGDEP